MGVSETGGTVSCIGNNDGSMTGIFFLDADSMAHVNFMGTVAVDMGSSMAKHCLPRAGLPRLSRPSRRFRGYTDQIAWL